MNFGKKRYKISLFGGHFKGNHLAAMLNFLNIFWIVENSKPTPNDISIKSFLLYQMPISDHNI